jgi:hypothetical protein
VAAELVINLVPYGSELAPTVRIIKMTINCHLPEQVITSITGSGVFSIQLHFNQALKVDVTHLPE